MLDFEQVKTFLAEDWSEFKSTLATSLESEYSLMSKVNSYVLGHSGKHIRSILALLTTRTMTDRATYPVIVSCVSAEIIHTASLLHDDVVDNSLVRRGAATIQTLYTPAVSVLLGDYWLSRAIKIVLKGVSDTRVIENYADALSNLAQGEILQMQKSQELNMTKEEYYTIIKYKTASLFVAAILSVAQISEFEEDAVKAFESYALELGLSFQIRDDILDYYNTDQIKKDTDSDILEKKITLPLLLAMENNPSIKEEIISRLGEITLNVETEQNQRHCEAIKSLVLANKGLSLANNVLEGHIKKAREALAFLNDSQAKSYLLDIASSLSLNLK